MTNKRRESRTGFYAVILCLILTSVSMLFYAEGNLAGREIVNEDVNFDPTKFISIEISHIPRGAEALMRAFLPSTSKAYAEEGASPPEEEADLDEVMDSDSIILSALEDGTHIINDPSGTEDLLDDDRIALLERAHAWQEYVVKQGETLSEIVAKFSGVDVRDVMRANELNNANRLTDKQILLIPLGMEFVEDTLEEVRVRKARIFASRSEMAPVQTKNYKVRDGDSLWGIANDNNIEIDSILGCNTLGTILRVGTSLRIPNQDGIFYKFKQGDTIEKVASTFRMSVGIIQTVNSGMELESLKVGAEIFLPGARPESSQEPEDEKPKPVAKPDQPQKKEPAQPKVESDGGVFRWPVAGKLTSTFGWRKHPISRRSDYHNAIDISAPRGTPIRASRSGTVVYVGWMGGYGRTVVVEHAGGYSTLYAHCSTTSVSKGQHVNTSTVIARVGRTGTATGNHVHFEVRRSNGAQNPLKLLK